MRDLASHVRTFFTAIKQAGDALRQLGAVSALAATACTVRGR
jgi:hypothetical protein